MSSSFLVSLLAVAVLALLMVWVMVQWGTAMLERPASGRFLPEAGSPAFRWGIAYLAVWAALAAAYAHLLGNLLLPLLFGVAWIAFSSMLVAFGRALARANERAAARAAEEPA